MDEYEGTQAELDEVNAEIAALQRQYVELDAQYAVLQEHRGQIVRLMAGGEL